MPRWGGWEHGRRVEEETRRTAVHQQMRMSSAELRRWASDLRQAPPPPQKWSGAPWATALAEQADLADALAPLREELDDEQWADLGRRLERGDDLDAASAAVRRPRG